MGVFNDTLMAELLEDLGQLREMDIVLVNWGAWYPRFTWGYTEVTPWRAHAQEQHELCYVWWLVSLPNYEGHREQSTSHTFRWHRNAGCMPSGRYRSHSAHRHSMTEVQALSAVAWERQEDVPRSGCLHACRRPGRLGRST